jgi:hypothetical protein
MSLIRTLTRSTLAVAGFALVFAATGGRALAVDSNAPELNPGSVASALTLLAGGVAMITASRRARN